MIEQEINVRFDNWCKFNHISLPRCWQWVRDSNPRAPVRGRTPFQGGPFVLSPATHYRIDLPTEVTSGGCTPRCSLFRFNRLDPLLGLRVVPVTAMGFWSDVPTNTWRKARDSNSDALLRALGLANRPGRPVPARLPRQVRLARLLPRHV